MSLSRDIRRLCVLHWPKRQGAGPNPVTDRRRRQLHARGLFVDTCLRQLHVTVWHHTSHVPPTGDIYRQEHAYRFLLEVTTGLLSAVPGETNVLGQFRDAWRQWGSTETARAAETLGGIISQVIRDARTIRREHLQGIGGSSYGSLVRRLIRPASPDRVLFVGHGKLARSMLPLFREYQTAVWNHREVSAGATGVDRCFLPDHGNQAARWADHVVLTTPADPLNDGRWMTWFRDADLRTVVHLGQRANGAKRWDGRYRFYSLDDVFAVREAQNALRSRRIAHAFQACRALAARNSRSPQPAALPVLARA
jgi:hypothetical protein